MEVLVEAMGAGVEAVIARGAPDCTLYLYLRELRTGVVRRIRLPRTRLTALFLVYTCRY